MNTCFAVFDDIPFCLRSLCLLKGDLIRVHFFDLLIKEKQPNFHNDFTFLKRDFSLNTEVHDVIQLNLLLIIS